MARSDVTEEAERLLRSGQRAAIEVLFRLIHAVNPSERGLDRRATQARYRLKAALQSRLIRDYGWALRVRPDPDDPDLVSLLHASLERDAAHARVSALDDEAQLWVRRCLVEGDPEDERREEARETSRAEDGPLRAGERAMADYDYERAEACFRQALPQGVAPAVALLDLMLLLGRDDEAGALVLSPLVRSAPEVRVRLAEAALALRRADEAEALCNAVRGARAGEVLRKVAQSRLADGDPAGAATALSRAREADPAHSDNHVLAERIEAARRERLRPLTEAAAAAIARSAWGEARSAVERLERAAGAGPAVVRFLAEIASGERRDRAAELVARADREPDRALALLCEARDLGRTDLAPRIAALEAAAEKHHRERARARVRSLLAGPDPVAGHLAFLGLPPDERAAFAADDPALRELARLASGRTPAEALHARDRLARARAAIDDRRFEHALACCAGLEDPAADAVRAAAEEGLRAQRAAERQARLAEALAAREAGDLVACEQALSRLDPGEDTEALRAWATDRRESLDAEATWARLSTHPVPLEARRFAEGRGWTARAEEMDRVVRDVFAIERVEPADLGWAPAHRWAGSNEADAWAPSAEGPIVVLDALAVILTVLEIDPRDSRIVGAIRIRTPIGLDRSWHGWDGQFVWVASRANHYILMFDPKSLRIEAWTDYRPHVTNHPATLFVRDGIAWIYETTEGAWAGKNDNLKLLDVRRRTLVRPQSLVQLPTLVPGSPPAILGIRSSGNVRKVPFGVYDAKGTSLGAVGAVGREPVQPIPDPEGDWLVPLRSRTSVAGDAPKRLDSMHDEVHELRLARVAVDREPMPIAFDPPIRVRFWGMFTARKHRVLVVYGWDDGDRWVSGYEIRGDRAVRLWHVTPAPEGMLLTAADASTGWLAQLGPDHRLLFTELGRQRPVLVRFLPWASVPAYAMSAVHCPIHFPNVVRVDPNGGAAPEELPPVPWAEVSTPAEAANTVAQHLGTQEGADMLRAARARWPHDGYLAMMFATATLYHGQIGEARAALEGFDPRAVSEAARRHRVHLLGAVAAQECDFARARALWESVRHGPGSCEVEHDLRWLDLLTGEAEPENPSEQLTCDALAACRHAIHALRSGRPGDAFRALDTPRLWELHEFQTALLRARAACAWTAGPAIARERAMAQAVRMGIANSGDPLAFFPVPGGVSGAESQSMVDDLTARVRWLPAEVYARERLIAPAGKAISR